ncbi:FitA-like ribbon-helix-helix domain-containing protein [Kribbella sp. NPDC020789]
MAGINVRNLDDHVKQRLRVRAARHGRSMEAEVRAILTEAVVHDDEPKDLATTLYERFQEVGGADLDLPPRDTTPPRSVDFD